MENILLTGVPGAGKTTLIQKVTKESKVKAGGFYTQEIRAGGRRTGFELITFSGKRGLLASVGIDSRCRVGKYGVDLAVMDELAVPEIRQALKKNDLIIIDEIGKMELFSDAFRQVVLQALDARPMVLATIMKHPHPFADGIKRRPDVRLIEVTEFNRNSLKSELLSLNI